MGKKKAPITNNLILDILKGINKQVSIRVQAGDPFANYIKLNRDVFGGWVAICSMHKITSNRRHVVAMLINKKISSGQISGLRVVQPQIPVLTMAIIYNGKTYVLGKSQYVDEERHLWYEVDLKKLKSDIETFPQK